MKKKIIIGFQILFLSFGSIYAQNKDYLNPKLSTDVRVKSLLSQMTLEEKVAQLDMWLEWNRDKYDGHKQLVDDIGVGGWLVSTYDAKKYNDLQKRSEKTRLKIPYIIGTDAAHGYGLNLGYTIFPTSISQAAMFNPELVRKMAVAAGKEIRSTGVHWTFAPSIDIVHDARWGRTGETYGEDPYLSSVLVVEAVKGYQNHDNPQDRVAACPKHLLGGGRSGGGVNHGSAEISEKMLRDDFLPPFKAAIDAGAMTIMPGHNDVNGIPCHSDKWLLTDVIKDEYGFKGFYITDMGDIENLVGMHRTAINQKDALNQSMNAGIDMHMFSNRFDSSPEGDFNFILLMLELIKEGKYSEAQLDESVARVLRIKFELGLFENRYVDEKKSTHGSKEAHQLALEGARESIILLKNEDNLLPLEQGKYKKILVTGPNANNQSILGDWSFTQPEDNLTTILQGVKDYVGNNSEVIFSYSGRIKGKKSDVVVSTTDSISTSKKLVEGGQLNEVSIADAVDKAKSCDLAIIAVGGYGIRSDWGLRTYGESADRPSIDFYGMQEDLIRAVAATGVPVIVVIVNGNPLNNEWTTKNIPTIVDVWEPGMYGGQALAEILFGEVNPSGRLPITVPQSAGQIPMYYYQAQSRWRTGYGLGSSRADDKPAYPFGYGLSYTTFDYTNPRVNSTTMTKGQPVEVSIDITNTGKVAGAETVQCYVRDDVSSTVSAMKRLKGFEKITLQPNETKTVTMSIPFDEFALWNVKMERVVEPGDFTIMIGSSAEDIKHNMKITY